jgi:predicted dehydrogenase
MAIDLTPQQRDLGKANFAQATGELTRRGFMKSLVAGGAVVPVAAAAYYGYDSFIREDFKPLRTALIGTGDEGGVLAGEHNPRYLEIVAVADVRPSNMERIFKGESGGPRKGLNFHYGTNCKSQIRQFADYRDLLSDSSLDIEAVVIALPLHLHAVASIEAMKAGKHVHCEKLMAWNIDQCKRMIRTADETGKILSIGHQRHYSLLYAQAQEAIQAGVLGDVKHIRALWHRNNTWPRVDKDGKPVPGVLRDSWKPEIKDDDRAALESKLRDLDYKSMEELVRWRLYSRTGGGLMAELGSHQLDACSIFLGKAKPLAVSAVGGKMFYTDDREVDDHVYVTYEFPGPGYFSRDGEGRPTRQVENKDDVVVVTYSSINTNQFERYGECLMGTRGTMVVEMEQQVLLYGENDPNLREPQGPTATTVTVTTAPAGQPVLETTASYGPAADRGPATSIAGTASSGPPSRGYREEMEHFAHCVRMQERAPDNEKRDWPAKVRCHGRVAMADAIVALTANLAMKQRRRIEFDDRWFDAASNEVPDAEMKALNRNGEPIDL